MSASTILYTGETAAYQAVSSKATTMQALRKASQNTGVDFSYLVAKASQESGLDASAKAKTSSATGLFQFIDQTWLCTVKNYGDKYGLSDVADRIDIGADGVARVSVNADKKAILDLRKDPEISACMAAELTNENKSTLEKKVGGDVGSTELYLAHFLGAGGACSFLNTMKNNPETSAASILPSAAAANKAVFYDKTGEARSVSEVYQIFDRKFANTQNEAEKVMASLSVKGVVDGSSLVKAQEAFSNYQLASTLSPLAPTQGVGILSLGGVSSPLAAMMIAQMDQGAFGLQDGLYNDIQSDLADWQQDLWSKADDKNKSSLISFAA